MKYMWCDKLLIERKKKYAEVVPVSHLITPLMVLILNDDLEMNAAIFYERNYLCNKYN